MSDGSEFQIMGAAILKPREAKVATSIDANQSSRQIVALVFDSCILVTGPFDLSPKRQESFDLLLSTC